MVKNLDVSSVSVNFMTESVTADVIQSGREISLSCWYCQWKRTLILNHHRLHGTSIMSEMYYPYTHQPQERLIQCRFYLHLLGNLLLMLHLRSPHICSLQRTCGLLDHSLFRIPLLQERQRKNDAGYQLKLLTNSLIGVTIPQ